MRQSTNTSLANKVIKSCSNSLKPQFLKSRIPSGS